MGDEIESICALAPGDEKKAFEAIGAFDLEACGIYSTCAHKVEKFYNSAGKRGHVELFYCQLDYWKVILTIVVLLLVAFYIKRKMVPKV